MPTIIDSLILELQLDPAKFQKGQKDATEAFVKTKEEAQKSGKSIEDASDKAAQSLAKVARQALELYAVFLGGRGVKQFIEDITAGDAALGRFSGSLSESPQTIAAWGLAVERVGGSSAATSASFQSLSDKIEDLRLRGKALPDVFYQLQAAGGRTIDLNHGVSKSMVDIAANLKAVAAHDQAKASWLGRQLGIDPDTVNMMIKYGAGIGAEIERLKKLGPSSKDIAAAQDLQKAWNELEQEAVHFGRAIWTSLSPALINAMERFDAWLGKKENQEKFNAVIKQFSDWIDSIDWDKTVTGIENFTTNADKAAQTVGGWVTIGESLFGVWAVSKIVGIASAVWGLVGALRAAVTASAALALNPVIAAAIAAGALYETIKPQSLNEGENELERQKKYGQNRPGGAPKADAPKADAPKSGAPKVDAPKTVAPKVDATDPSTPPAKSILGSIAGAIGELLGIKVAKADGIQTEGRQVGRSNPLPVVVTNSGADQLFGKGVNGSTGPGGGGGSTPGGSGGGRGSRGGGGGGTPASGDGRGHLASGAEREAFIRAEAIKRGIDPDIAMKVARSEGFGKFTGDYGTSHGDFQLHQASNIPGMRSRGLGDDFKRDTGLDPADPKNWKQADQYALNKMVEQGLTPWHGWKGAARAGLGSAHQVPVDKTPWVPKAAAAVTTPRVAPSPSVTHNNTSTPRTSSNSTETHIGSITVQTQATDAAGIAKELPKAIERSSFASQANSGPE